jgi:hypothetical protein
MITWYDNANYFILNARTKKIKKVVYIYILIHDCNMSEVVTCRCDYITFLPFQKSHNIQNIFLFQINRNTIYKWLIIYLTNICDDMLTYRPCNKILRHLTMASQNFILYIWYVFLLIKVSYYAIQTQNFFFLFLPQP